jgi:putative ABC transport system substrate-binding protein
MNVGRRDFITILGGVAAWPMAARAQQPALPVIGYLSLGTPESVTPIVAAFRQGLAETGFVEGRNVVVDYRWTEDPARLPDLAADLVRRNVAAIISGGGVLTATTVKAATSTIPVIFEVGNDPVQYGLVASLSRPGGNLTGVNSLIAEAFPKGFELLTKLLPNSRVFAVVMGPNTPDLIARAKQEAQATADALGRKLLFANPATPQEIDEAVASLVRQGADAIVFRASPLTNGQRERLVALAARYSVPAIYAFREAAEAGGLMSYGVDIRLSFHLVGVYAGRILKGEKPADLPVQQATKFELIINLKTAKTLGIEVPSTLLAIADEVIE